MAQFGEIGTLELDWEITSTDVSDALREARRDEDCAAVEQLKAANDAIDRCLKKMTRHPVLGWWLHHDGILHNALQDFVLTTDRFHEDHWVNDLGDDDDWREAAMRLEREGEISRVMVGTETYWII